MIFCYPISKVQLHFKIGELFIYSYNNAPTLPHGNTTGTHKHQSQVGHQVTSYPNNMKVLQHGSVRI